MADGITYEVHPAGFEDFQAYCDRWGTIADAELRHAMRQSVNALHREAVKNAPNNTGNLRGAIFSRIEGMGSDIRGVVAVGPAAPYGICVETGTKPHWMPIAPLLRWVHKRMGLDGSHMWAVAKVIQKKIAERGTEGQFFFQRAADSEQGRIDGFFKAAMDRAMAQ